MIFILLVLGIFTVMISLILYRKTVGVCKSSVCLVGKTALVTGANAGIGYETALEFAKRGAKVILACRDEAKAQEAVDTIKKETHNKNVYYKIVDFSSLTSVRVLAREIIAAEDRLDILVNNAGTAILGSQLSEDRIPLVFQVNYLSHFLLTNLLLDLLMKNPSRVINVSSMLARTHSTPIDFNNLTSNNGDYQQYARSKLCQIFFTIEFAKRYADTNVTIYSLHPGFVRTNIFNNLWSWLTHMALFVANLYGKSPEEGAQTQIYCAIANGLEQYSGEHFQDCHVMKRYKSARDPAAPRILWDESEKLVSLK